MYVYLTSMGTDLITIKNESDTRKRPGKIIDKKYFIVNMYVVNTFLAQDIRAGL